MTWLKVDDGLMQHPKVRAIPRKDRMRVMGQWMACGLWCASQLTDGVLPGSVVGDEGGRGSDTAVLVRVGLWHEHGHGCTRCAQPELGGYVFHDYLDYNRSRGDVHTEREANAERQSRLRKRRRNGDSNAVTPPVSNAVTPPVSNAVTPPVSNAPRNGGVCAPRPVLKYLGTSVTSSSYVSDARQDRQTDDDDGSPNDETLDAWTPGSTPPTVDVLAERAAFRAQNAGRWNELRSVRGAWRGWLTKAADRNKPTPAPGRPTCPIHPDQPTGSKPCPSCDAEALPARQRPDLRAVLRGVS